MIDYESIGYRMALLAMFSLVSVGVYLGAFWLINDFTPLTVDIQLFLDEFAVAFVFASFAVQISQNIIAELSARA